MSQRLWFAFRAWAAGFFFGPVCPDCDLRHGTKDIADTLGCLNVQYRRRQAAEQRRIDSERVPKRLLLTPTPEAPDDR